MNTPTPCASIRRGIAHLLALLTLSCALLLAAAPANADNGEIEFTTFVELIKQQTELPLYNIDTEGLPAQLAPLIKRLPDLRLLTIKDPIDNSIVFSVQNVNGILHYNQPIKNDVALIKQMVHKSDVITHDGEQVGLLDIYYLPPYFDRAKKIGLTDQELAWVADHRGKITLGFYDWAPFQSVNSSGEMVGMTRELIDLISKRTGLKFRFSYQPSWSAALNSLQHQQIDLIADMYRTDERLKHYRLSKPYFSNNAALFATPEAEFSTLADLNGHSVVEEEGYSSIELIKKAAPSANILIVKDTATALNWVATGKAEAYYGATFPAAMSINEQFITNVESKFIDKSNSDKTRTHFAMLRSAPPTLINILNKGIDAITKQELLTITQPYMVKTSSHHELLSKKEKNALLLYSGIGLFILLILLLVSIVVRYQVSKNRSEGVDFHKVRRILIAIAVLFDIALIIGSSIALHSAEQEARQDTINHLETVLQMAHDNLVSWRDHYIKILTNLSTNSPLGGVTAQLLALHQQHGVLQGSSALQDARTVIQQLLKERNLVNDGYFLIAPDGTTLATSEDNQTGKENPIQQASPKAIQYALQGHTAITPPISHTDAKGGASLFVITPIRDQHRVVALFALQLAASKEFSDILHRARIGESGETYAVDERGIMVSDSRFEADLVKLKLIQPGQHTTAILPMRMPPTNMITNPIPFTDADRNKWPLTYMAAHVTKHENGSNSEGYGDYRGVPVMGVWHWLDAFGFGVTTEIDDAEAMADYYTLRRVIYIIVGTSIFMVLVLIGMFSWVGANATRVLEQQVEDRTRELNELYTSVRESIEYASIIQRSLLPEHTILDHFFPDSMVYWIPRDTVGGDIYLIHEFNQGDDCLIATIDCTGHGVPGAFVTMLVKAIERSLVARIHDSSEEIEPGKILSIFNRSIRNLLKQDDPDTHCNAGFDGGVIHYNKRRNTLTFAGAETALFYLDGGKVKAIRGSRHSVGYKKSDPDFVFKEHRLDLHPGMRFYITSDGYLDQNGGEKGFPFGKKRFQSLILEYADRPLREQAPLFEQALLAYQGDEGRNDDVTLIAFEIGASEETQPSKEPIDFSV